MRLVRSGQSPQEVESEAQTRAAQPSALFWLNAYDSDTDAHSWKILTRDEILRQLDSWDTLVRYGQLVAVADHPEMPDRMASGRGNFLWAQDGP